MGDHQCGFRRNRSATDHIFCIHQILEKKWEHNEEKICNMISPVRFCSAGMLWCAAVNLRYPSVKGPKYEANHSLLSCAVVTCTHGAYGDDRVY
jgi:hypothetical protein